MTVKLKTVKLSSDLQLECQFKNIDLVTCYSRRIVEAFGTKIAMLVVRRNTGVEATDDIIHPSLDFFPFAAVVRLSLTKPFETSSLNWKLFIKLNYLF